MQHLKRKQVASSNYHYIKFSLDYFLRSMQALDQHHIEFYAASPHLYIGDAVYSDVVSLKKRLDAAQLKVCCLTQEQCVYPINLACEDNAVRERSIQSFFTCIEFANLLHAPYCQVVAGRGCYDNPEQDAWKRSAESIARIVDKAARYGVTMVLEAASYHTTNVVYTTQGIRRMIDEIRSPHLKGMLDTCAVAMAGEDFKACVELLGQDLAHLHFADGTPAGHLLPGEGNLPLEEYLHILDKAGYSGAIPFEIYNKIYDFKPHEHMQACLDYIYGLIPAEKEAL